MLQVRILLAAILLLVAASAGAAKEGEDAGPILVRNVTVIDGLGNLPAPMRDMLIVDGRIAKMSVTGMIGDLPDGVRTIDGEGLTAMPGLIDLHVHLDGVVFGDGEYKSRERADVQKTLNAHLYSGVTSVLDLGNEHDFIVKSPGFRRARRHAGPTNLRVRSNDPAAEDG